MPLMQNSNNSETPGSVFTPDTPSPVMPPPVKPSIILTPPPPQKPRKKKHTAGFLLACLLFVIGASSAYALGVRNKVKQTVVETPAQMNPVDPSPTPAPVTQNPSAPPPVAQQPPPVSAERKKNSCDVYEDVMPQSVCDLIGNISSNGLKGNENVAFDTSAIPSDSKVQLDTSTWIRINEHLGSIKGTVTTQGVSYKGSLTMSDSSGNWKVISFIQN